MHNTTLFHHNRLLQVGLEGTIGGALGERATMPEGGGLAAVCTLSHDLEISFLAIIPNTVAFYESTAFYHRKFPCSRQVVRIQLIEAGHSE